MTNEFEIKRDLPKLCARVVERAQKALGQRIHDMVGVNQEKDNHVFISGPESDGSWQTCVGWPIIVSNELVNFGVRLHVKPGIEVTATPVVLTSELRDRGQRWSGNVWIRRYATDTGSVEKTTLEALDALLSHFKAGDHLRALLESIGGSGK